MLTADPHGVNVQTPAQAVLDRMKEQRQEFVDFLEALVRAESPSTDPGSQAQVRDILNRALTGIGFETSFIPGVETGGHLVAQSAGSTDGSAVQLIVGHMDTVWPVGTLARMPIETDQGKLTGPGSFDMKGGLAIGIFALRALSDLGVEPAIRPVFFINSDEEIGSPESASLIMEWAGRASRVFVLEPALGPRGCLKTRRKGVTNFTVRVHGRSAHSGLAPEEGASAIHELAYVIRRLVELEDPSRGTTVNVGIIKGGSRSNVVADLASAVVDIRVWTEADGEKVREAVTALKPETPGAEIIITDWEGRAPLERTPRNRRLWEAAQEIGNEIGLELEEGSAGGGSDGNLTSPLAPTLDGLGAVGDGAHAVHEHILIDAALERTALLAGLLSTPEN